MDGENDEKSLKWNQTQLRTDTYYRHKFKTSHFVQNSIREDQLMLLDSRPTT
jgi:hypothetical protein